MQTKIKETSQQDYPLIKSHNGRDQLIVLFTSSGVGTCIHGDRLGDYATDWSEANFTLFDKEITLKN
jgi:hypothetical protein